MSIDKSGGPAFPLPLGNEQIDSSVAGMTLRDYFAAKAMQSMIIRADDRLGIDQEPTQPNKWTAKCSYAMADAMLSARKVKK